MGITDYAELSFYRENTIANAKAFYGPDRTYDVIGARHEKAYLVAYTKSIDGSIKGEILLFSTWGSSSDPAIKRVHETLAKNLIAKLNGKSQGEVFIQTQATQSIVDEEDGQLQPGGIEWDDSSTLRNA